MQKLPVFPLWLRIMLVLGAIIGIARGQWQGGILIIAVMLLTDVACWLIWKYVKN